MSADIKLLLLFEIDESPIPPPTDRNFLLASGEYFILANNDNFLLAGN